MNQEPTPKNSFYELQSEQDMFDRESSGKLSRREKDIDQVPIAVQEHIRQKS